VTDEPPKKGKTMNYFKIFNESDKHNNFQFKDGLNTDSQKFNSNPNQECGSGGLYFSNENNILGFLEYGDFIREVEIPADETNILHFENKSRAKSLFLHPKKDLRKVETWHWLKEKNVNIRVDYENALRWAATYGHLEVVKYLVQNGANVNNNSALRWAAYNGHLEIVKFLLENGANVHAWNDSALRSAAENGHLEIVEFLVQNGANVHANNNSALRWAAIYGHLEVVKFLLEDVANVHALKDSALRFAAEHGHLEVVKYLVQNGANVNAYDDFALLYAAQNGHLEIVEYLESLLY
jgi:ankyrin repeat protein